MKNLQQAENFYEQKKHKEQFPKPEEFLFLLQKSGLEKHLKTYERLLEVSSAIKENGGRALLVGGSVRDIFLGKISKDFDLEVYGLELEQLEKVVREFGQVSEVGKSFGILKLKVEGGLEVDISLPRTDSKTGKGHKGFDVKTNPFLSFEQAARRRDFTINAIMADPLTGEVIDPFNGMEDIQNKILRIVDEKTFADDPLRVLRALQFVARFELTVDEQSFCILQYMKDFLTELPKERITEEWRKLFLKSKKPSLGLDLGMKLGVWEILYPELVELKKTKQDRHWHAEGNVWTHTLMVVDQAKKVCDKYNLDEDTSLVVLFSALCHDLGKPLTTKQDENGRITSYGHEKAGVEVAMKFLSKFTFSGDLKKKIVKLVEHHSRPVSFYLDEVDRAQKITDATIRRLAKKLYPATIVELVYVSEADLRGRISQETSKLFDEQDRFLPGLNLLQRAKDLNVENSKPQSLTRGKDWLDFGFKPGKHIGELIKLADLLRDQKGFSKQQIFEAVKFAGNPQDAVCILQGILNS